MTRAAPGTVNSDNAAPSRDLTITRLAVLKAAAEFAASKPEASSKDVLKVAVLWERWVTRTESQGLLKPATAEEVGS